jgi:cytochrome c biogenesis protein ResB
MSRHISRHRPASPCKSAHRGVSHLFKSRIERNPTLWYLSSLCAAFMVGLAVPYEIQHASGLRSLPEIEYRQITIANVSLRSKLLKALRERDVVIEELTASRLQAKQRVSQPEGDMHQKTRHPKCYSPIPPPDSD